MNSSVRRRHLYLNYVSQRDSSKKEGKTKMPFVEVHMIEGRTDEQRAKIAKAFTDALVQVLGIKGEDVWIQFTDMPKTRFATSGILKSKK